MESLNWVINIIYFFLLLGFGDVRDFSDDSFGDEMDEEFDVELDVSKGMRSEEGFVCFRFLNGRVIFI